MRAHARPVVHTCSICSTTEPWGPGWSWWGSYLDTEQGRPIVKVCSDTCRKSALKQGLHNVKYRGAR